MRITVKVSLDKEDEKYLAAAMESHRLMLEANSREPYNHNEYESHRTEMMENLYCLFSSEPQAAKNLYELSLDNGETLEWNLFNRTNYIFIGA